VHEYLLRGWCPPTTSLFLLRREVFDTGIRFEPELPSFQDLDLWLRVSQAYEFDYVDEPLVIQHAHRRERVSTDPQVRTQALGILLENWAQEMRDRWGEAAVEEFVKGQETSLAYRDVMRLAHSGRRTDAFRRAARLLRGHRLSAGRFTRVIAALIGLHAPLQWLRAKCRW
jgi:hypothetical protein